MEMTVEALLPETEKLYNYLDEDVKLFQRISRRVFDDINSECFLSKYESYPEYTKYIKRHYNILTRTANSIVRSEKGRHNALLELKKEEQKELTQKIRVLESDSQSIERRVGELKDLARRNKITPKQLTELRKRKKALHEWKGKLERLKTRKEKLERQIKSGHIPLTYGSKRNFKAQFHLEVSGYSDFDDWKEKHYFSLNHNIFYIGRIDEKNCNQIVQLTAQEDGKFSMKLLLDLPFREEGKPKTIEVKGIRIRYCADLLRYYLSAPTKEEGKRPISYRFHKRENGKWYLQIIFDTDDIKPKTDPARGVLSIDYNDGFLAVVELDSSGNICSLEKIELNYHGTGGAALAEIRDVSKQIAIRAFKIGKPVIVEDLDFRRTKAKQRKNKNKYYNKIIHKFDYSRFIETLERACNRQAVGFAKVNPAYTTKIGLEKYANLRKLNVHFSAALIIGRRFMGFSDSIL